MQNDEGSIGYDMLYCIYDKVRCAWEATLWNNLNSGYDESN